LNFSSRPRKFEEIGERLSALEKAIENKGKEKGR